MNRKPIVLIVDDDAANIQAIAEVVAGCQYLPVLATGGEEALAYLDGNRPDVILLDVVMPKMDGYQICAMLKANPVTADIPVIFLTAKSNPQDVARGFEAGGVDFIAKPFHPIELKARLRTHLDYKESRDELKWYNEQLKSMNEELEQAKEELEQEIRRRDDFEKALQISKARFRHTFQQAAVGMAHVGMDAKCFRVNSKLCETLGYSERELRRIPLHELTHPDDVDRVKKQFARLWSGEIENYSLEKRLFAKDGSVVWSDITVSLVRRKDGQPDYVIYVLQEIGRRKAIEAELQNELAERRQIQKDLKKERDFSSAIVDTAGSLIIVLDGGGHITRFNKACELMTGYSFDEVQGRCLWDFLVIDEERSRVKAILQNSDITTFPNYNENYWLAKNGGKRRIAWSNTAITDNLSQVEFVIGIGIDITEQRVAEEALLKAYDELELRVAERTGELTHRNAELQVEINERKLVEEALRNSEARNKALLQAVPDVIFRASREGILLDVVVPQNFTLAWEIKSGCSVFDLFPDEEGAEESRRCTERILANGGMQTMEFQVTIDGVVRNRELRMFAVGEEVWAILRDDTDNKHAEACNLLLRDITLMVLAEKPIHEVLQVVCEKLSLQYGFLLVFIGLKENDGAISVLATAGAAKGKTRYNLMRWDGDADMLSPSGEVIRNGQALFGDVEAVRSPFWRDIITRGAGAAFAGLPLKTKQQTWGVLSMVSPKQGFFSKECTKQLENFADQIAIAINAAFIRQQLQLITTALTAANAVAITDRMGNVQWCNAAFSRLTGYKLEEVVGQNLRILKSGGQNQEFYAKFWQQILSGRMWRGEMVNKRKDGSVYTEESVVTPVRNEQGDIKNFVSVKQDVTDRKKAQEVAGRYRLLSENIQDIILMEDEDGRIIEANVAAVHAYGYDKEELLSLNIADLHHETDNPITEYYHEIIYSGKFIETLHRCKDGSLFPAEMSITAANIGGERIFLSVIRDVTERKNSEAQMIATKERMAQAERLASLGVMAAGIAHEINQPLNAIKVAIDAVLYWHQRGKVADINEFIDDIANISGQAQRIDKIVKQMRAFVSTGRQSDLELINVNDVVVKVRQILGAQMESHGVTVKLKLAETLPKVRAAHTAMEGIVINLMVNAMQALDNLQQRNKWIEVGTGVSGKVVLEIRDNGTGIDDAIIDRIFTPFFSTKTSEQSMGIGLSIVHSLVVSIGGQISVFNNDAGGATFRMEFPAVKEEEKEYEYIAGR